MTTKCRVYYQPDGRVNVIHPIDKSRRQGETEANWLKRVYEKTKEHIQGLSFDDKLISDLPADRTQRFKWRKKIGGGVFVDTSIVDPMEELNNQVESEKTNLPTWAQVVTAINNAFSNTAQAALIKKIARPVYTHLKNSVS